MARKIKFPLKMADGAEVRTLDELKEHFDVESVVGYFSDGRLLNWLRTRYYDDEADKIEQLTASDSELHKKICEIFGVESEAEIDPEEIARRQERLNRLKQYTDDRDILERVDQVAFDQEELSDLLDEDATLIYLCNNRFTIPLRVTDKTYIGVGKAIAVIRSGTSVNFDDLHITLKNILFDEKYEAVLKTRDILAEKQRIAENAMLPKKLYDEAIAADNAGDDKTALEKFKESANLGYPKAFGAIGGLYFIGESVPKDDEEAKRWYKLGMEKNDGNSFAGMGLLLFDKNDGKAFEMFKRANELGNEMDVNFFLGKIYREGKGTEKNFQKAFDHFKKGADAGDATCLKMLGLMYHNGEYVEKNPGKAFDLTKKAAEAGDVEAMNIVGGMYYDGYGVSENLEHAFIWLKKAAENGDVDSMNPLGNMYLRGEGVSQNNDEAFRWYQKAAENGDLWGMYNLSHMYRRGKGTSKNVAEGIRLLDKAAQLGLTDAATRLGHLYRDGDGVAQNFYKAADYYKQAVDSGDGDGMNGLGLLYDFGQGVKEDKKLAFQWYLRAAQAGSLIGMANVGGCYLWGSGTSKDMIKAGNWLKQSAEGGNAYGMLRYGDYFFEYNNTSALEWYKKAFDLVGDGEAAYKIYKIYKEGKCGINKNSSQADYWERKYKSLGYKPDDGCFITTAVCENFGKPDDCYELTTFRNFRDGWLTAQPDGKSLIAEYYAVAPAIVDKISHLPDASKIYADIRTKYLAPCLTFIEHGDNQSCKRLYVEMVTSLKKKFLEG